MFESIIRYASMVVSCGPCASIPYAGIACSLFALPLIVFFQMFYWFLPSVCVVLLGLSVCVVLASFLIVVLTHQPTVFIVDKIVGVMLAFMTVPFTAKFMVVGLVLFHSIRLLVPLVLKAFRPSMSDKIWYPVIVSLGAGLLANAFLRLIMWTAA